MRIQYEHTQTQRVGVAKDISNKTVPAWDSQALELNQKFIAKCFGSITIE